MTLITVIAGIIIILLVLWEGFETIILPRRVTRRLRFTRFYYRWTWLLWAKWVYSISPDRWRETLLSVFGPLSLLMLMSIWVVGLITGFALLYWSVAHSLMTYDGSTGFFINLYLSGTSFFTLGLGDVIPRNNLTRLLVVIESGMGFGFLALVISYLPALNQSFARREVTISLLDARAGSPPTASEMLRRHDQGQETEELRELLYEWERWAAELLEGHLSYPIMAYFRSQHDNQSWLAALAAVLVVCSLILAGSEGSLRRQAERTFAMARHAVVDLCLVFSREPMEPKYDRLSPEERTALGRSMAERNPMTAAGGDFDLRLAELRRLYESYLYALAVYFRINLPPWVAAEGWVDNWQATMWDRPAAKGVILGAKKGKHF